MVTLTKSPANDRRNRRNLRCRAMVQQAVQGAPAAYAKEMERLSAKESLLLAVSFKHQLFIYFEFNSYISDTKSNRNRLIRFS